MIKNVVFDFGQVLVHFDPRYMVAQYVTDREDAVLLETVLFDRLYWDELDAGTISDEDTLKAVCERLPKRLWDTATDIYYHWIYMLPEIDGMRQLVTDLKASGVPLYLLSNISHYFADHRDEIPILRLFDRCLFSAKCGMTKPHCDIFEHLCEVCDCAPQETLFIDDSAINIRGAEEAGLQTYLFDGNAHALRADLVKRGLLTASP